MRLSSFVLCLVAALSCGGALAQSTDAAPTADAASAMKRPGDAAKRWTIDFDRSAKSDGQIKFLVWQNDEDAPTQVVVPIRQGQTENSIALATRDLFRDMLGTKDFETDVAKGDVFVRVKRDERRFSVQVRQNTAEGVRVDLYAR
ncbi:hypothetical protein AB4059_01660 [Lysobacter sp. 2RAF19]